MEKLHESALNKHYSISTLSTVFFPPSKPNKTKDKLPTITTEAQFCQVLGCSKHSNMDS